MKYIEVDEELYRFIASKTERIGESASDILRRVLGLDVEMPTQQAPEQISHPSMEGKESTAEVAPKVSDNQVAAASAQVQLEVNSHEPATILLQDLDEAVSETKLAQQKGAVGKFLFVLESMYQQTGTGFAQVLEIQGRDRLYFATSKAALLEKSQSANPKEIGKSGYWVTTNNNTAKKRTILNEVFIKFGCSEFEAKKLSERTLPVPVKA